MNIAWGLWAELVGVPIGWGTIGTPPDVNIAWDLWAELDGVPEGWAS